MELNKANQVLMRDVLGRKFVDRLLDDTATVPTSTKFRQSGYEPTPQGAEVEACGVSLTLANGYRFSVQWHDGAYSSLRYVSDKATTGNMTVELAVLVNGDFVEPGLYGHGNGDEVVGHLSLDEVAQVLRTVDAWPVYALY